MASPVSLLTGPDLAARAACGIRATGPRTVRGMGIESWIVVGVLVLAAGSVLRVFLSTRGRYTPVDARPTIPPPTGDVGNQII